jgi:hypothetical protein
MQYDFNLAAGAAQSFDVVGKFIKYQNGTGLIRVRMSMGEYVDLLPGQGVFSVDYTRFTVTDRTGAQNTGALLAGDFDFRDSRITGDVNVIDNAKAEVLAGSSFVANTSKLVATGAQYLSFSLWNPIGSTKRVAINSLTLFSSIDMDYYMFSNDVDLIQNSKSGWNKNVGGVTNVGGAVSVARTNYLFSASGANPVEIVPAIALGTLAVKAGVPYMVTFKKPVILRAGCGYGAVAQSPGTTGGFIYDFEEF